MTYNGKLDKNARLTICSLQETHLISRRSKFSKYPPDSGAQLALPSASRPRAELPASLWRAAALLSRWAVDGTGCRVAGGPAKIRARRRRAITVGGPSAPSAAAGPGAKPLTAQGRRRQPTAQNAGRAEPAPTQKSRWTCEHRRQPRFRPAPLPPHLPASRGSPLRPQPAQRGAPTVQLRAEGLLKRGQSGLRPRRRREPAGDASKLSPLRNTGRTSITFEVINCGGQKSENKVSAGPTSPLDALGVEISRMQNEGAIQNIHLHFSKTWSLSPSTSTSCIFCFYPCNKYMFSWLD
nr:uncharacterized protein LOC109023850 [Gorilla gorilla gorilla]